MSAYPPQNFTQLLLDWQSGDRTALDALMPAVYAELKRLALSHLRRERPFHTLQATALVNEAYLKLIDSQQVNWQSRAHFFGAAAEVIRRILIDYARAQGAQKRGGDRNRVSLTEANHYLKNQQLDIVELNDALDELSTFDPQLGRLVELRFFGGLSVEETAEVLNISKATFHRQWQTAKTWLYRRISKAENG